MLGDTNASDIKKGQYAELSLPSNPSGLTLGLRDDQPIRAMRVGDLIIEHAAIVMNGTFTGSTGWQQILPNVNTSALVNPGETATPPWIINCRPSNYASDIAELLQGRFICLINGGVYNNWYISLQIAWFVRR